MVHLSCRIKIPVDLAELHKIPLKVRWEERIKHKIIKLYFTYISCYLLKWLSSIKFLICWWYLMLHILTSNWFVHWQKYPKSKKLIRILQPETLNCIKCPTFPEMGSSLLGLVYPGIDMVQTCSVHVFWLHIQEQIFVFLYIHDLDMYIQLSRCI